MLHDHNYTQMFDEPEVNDTLYMYESVYLGVD